MRVEAAWRGEGRLEILVSGIQPAEADALLESIGAADHVGAPNEMVEGPVGWAIGTPAGQWLPAVWHRWSGRYMSECSRWRADHATGPFRPFLEDEKACRECAA